MPRGKKVIKIVEQISNDFYLIKFKFHYVIFYNKNNNVFSEDKLNEFENTFILFCKNYDTSLYNFINFKNSLKFHLEKENLYNGTMKKIFNLYNYY